MPGVLGATLTMMKSAAACACAVAAFAVTPVYAGGPRGATEAETVQPKPNILLLVLDDIGFSDLGAYGSEIRTPVMDLLARHGIRYNRFETKAVCSPTRAALLTGRNAHTVWMADLPSDRNAPDLQNTGPWKGEMPANAETLAQALKHVGYNTWAVGKWHLAPKYDALVGSAKASWPLQRGFDHFYGFIGGWTDQYRPALVQDNTPIKAPTGQGYHLTEDLIDRTIAAFEINRETSAGRPAFIYLALGAAHAPLQVPKRYIDQYAGVYDKGWDALRAERFERQKALGVIPVSTKLPRRNAGDPAWESLDDQQKRVFARFMATYAGFLTHTDEQIGRLVDYLKHTGQYDNTLIVLMSDNGAAGEGGQTGGFRVPYADRTTVAEMAAHLGELGSSTTKPLYQRPWAMVGSTPFRRYKLWPYAGGTRAPLVISWPDRIKARGVIRSQLVDVIDIAPTLLEVAGTAFRSNIDGVEQLPVAGRSISPTFNSSTRGGRTTQFFEMRGNRAITSGRWKAVAMHRCEAEDFEADRWELFDVKKDFAETTDLSRKYPKKLRALQRLWWSEATKFSLQSMAKPNVALCKFNEMDGAFLEDEG